VSAPDVNVLVSFGLDRTAHVERLPGGQGTAWRSGDVVLKSVADAREHAWVCDVYDGWPPDAGVSVPAPLRDVSGSWAAAGWGAHHLVPGAHLRCGDDPGRFREAAERFHAVTAGLARPAFLDDRADPWSHGDRVAWEGAAPDGAGELRRVLDAALAAREPGELPAQVVHGDLTTNVLWSPDGPGIIDWPPYHRPPGWALAVAAVDALCWESASDKVLEAWADQEHWRQLLVRALVYRLATRARVEGSSDDVPEADVLVSVLARRD